RDPLVQERAETILEVRHPALEAVEIGARHHVGAREDRPQPADGLLLEIAEEALGPRLEIAPGRLRTATDLAAQAVDLVQQRLESRLVLAEEALAELREPLEQLLAARLQ